MAHKAVLVNALSRALAERAVLMDFTIGRKGFLNYLKSLGGSNTVKVVPSASVSASGLQANGHKGLKVICGNNTSYLEDMAWVGEKTPLTLCDVRVSSHNTVMPNIGGLELAEALSRVMPFTAKEDNRPVLQCVLFKVSDGKLKLVSADGFRLAVVKLDFEGDDWQVLINRDDLMGIASALRRAKRVRISYEGEDVTRPSSLILDTELIRYRWLSIDSNFPEYEKLIPTEINTVAHFDTVEALKGIGSLKVLADSKAYPIDLTLDNGGITMTNPDDKGQVAVPADIEGKPVKVRIDGSYLAQALKACGGMVDLKLTNAYSPVLFTVDGYQLVVMPMMTDEANEQAKVERQARGAEAKVEVETETEADVVTEAETETQSKRTSCRSLKNAWTHKTTA